MPRKTISLRLDPELLERVDALASERGVRRTVVIEEALAEKVRPYAKYDAQAGVRNDPQVQLRRAVREGLARGGSE